MPQVIVDNRYKILKELGVGAMGEVFQVTDSKNDKVIALKILSKEKTSSEAVQRFKREFQLLAELHHPNLCAVYDFGMLNDGRSYFTMEHIDGKNIFEAAKELPREKIYPWIVQLCRVLEYIHAKGLIHYDIKPGNVLIQNAGDNTTVKLMDFGLAGEHWIKGGAVIKGTFPYIAPEIIKGFAVDHRADLYSLGVLLYEIFSRKAFQVTDKESFVALLKQGTDRISEPISKIVFDIPKDLEQLISRLLEPEPSERYSRANELIKEINRISDFGFEIETEQTIEGYLLSSKFVGRDQEMDVLRSFYEKARNGEGRIVLITGEVGIGKSRLLKEFKVFAQLKRSYCFTGYAYENKTNPLESFYDIFRELINYINNKSGLSGSKALKVSLAVLFKMFPDLSNDHLRKKLPHLAPLEPNQEKLRNFQALFGLIDYLASILGGFVILLEDLQWADELSIQFLEYLGNNLRDKNIFICGACRHEALEDNLVLRRMIANLENEGSLSQVELKTFDVESLRAFLDSTITPGSNSSELVQYLMKKTGGNPFFVEEIMRTLLRTRSVSIGEKMAVEHLQRISIPATIEDIVLKRIKDLDGSSERVVKFGAVLLKDFSYDLMKDLTGLEDTTLSKVLWDLKRRQVLAEETNRYRFYHGTLREAVNKRLSHQEEQQLNYQVGNTLENINRGRLARIIDDLAFYFINAQDEIKGVKYGLRAAREGSEKYANEQAIRFYCGVLSLLADKNPQLRFDILQKVAQIEFFAGYYDDAIKHHEQSLNLSFATAAQQADIYRRIGDVYRKKPKYVEALVCYRKGINLLEGSKENQQIAFIKGAINAGMAFAYLGMGNSESANQFNLDAVKLLKGIKRKEAIMLLNDVIYSIGIIDIDRGNYNKAFFNFRKAYERNKNIKNEIGMALILFAFGYGYYLKGNLDRAFAYYQKAVRISEKIGNPRGVSRALIQMAVILYAKGDRLKALEYFQKAISISTKIGAKREVALSLQGIGNCFMMLCDYKNAQEHYERVLKLWDDLGVMDNRALTLLDIGSICKTMGDYDSAIRFYKKAFKILKNIRRPHEISLAYAKLASVLIDIGDFLQAQGHIDNALSTAATVDAKVVEAECYQYLCLINIINKKYALGYDFYKKGVKIIKELGLRKELLKFLILLSDIYYYKSDYQKGMAMADKAMELARNIDTRDLYVETLLVKAKNKIGQGPLSKIEVVGILNEAIKIAEEISCPEILWKVYYEFGRFLEENKEPHGALKYYQKCIMVFRDVVSKIKNETYKKSYLNRPDRQAVFAMINRLGRSV